jgi:glutamine amidotransferase PdxT
LPPGSRTGAGRGQEAGWERCPQVLARPPERVGVLALQGDFREHIELLRHLGADAFEVRGPAELRRAGAIVLPGGESTTMSLLLQSSGLLGPLGERLARPASLRRN